jgi:hypothetical protein
MDVGVTMWQSEGLILRRKLGEAMQLLWQV